MATLIPTTQTTGVEAYEDMFKEITRKLYGEETGHGLHTLGTPMAHVATSGPTLPEGERSFTTLMADRSLTTIEYENNASETNNTFKTEDHITTAFGLAALMQNGFPPPGAISHNFQSSSSSASRNGNNSFMVNDERWPGNSEECLPWNANKNATYNCNQKTSSKHKNRDYSSGEGGSAGDAGTSSSGQKGNSSVRSGNNPTGAAKRYNCQSCPYSTDRRDLFTRHENIHKDEKPFHCYACLKQFNRADHVKKHFLRMHRELNYDINKTRKTSSGGSSSAGTSNPPPKAPTNYSINANSLNQQQQQQQQHISEFLGGRSSGAATETATNGGQQNPPEIHQQSQQQNDTEQQEKMRLEHVHVEKKMKTEKLSNSGGGGGGSSSSSSGGNQGAKKKQGDKRYVCCYCPWTGADNWGLKRHLNTHTKPFVCIMCDYKAARSERLATHVFKVHNKKACNKCNFLADDQAQFITHQTEVHSLTHNSNVDNCGGAAGSGYNSNNNNQNLSDLGIQQWRSTNRSSNNSTNQKKGAERLFQYMEADGSDPEDYSRQLRMAALSRNTASVAQDFHNAGGGDKMIVPPSLAIIGSLMEQFMQQQQQQSERWEESSGDGYEEAHHQHMDTSGDSSGANSNSPPAINHYQMMNNNNKKHRRRSSCHDKENTNYAAIPHKHCDKYDDKMWMKEIITNFYAHFNSNNSSNSSGSGVIMRKNKLNGNGSIGQISQKLAQQKKNKDDEEKRQQQQVAVISPSSMSKVEESSSEKRNRKQPQPRKIPQTDTTNVARIRDKHLTRLVSRQKSCQICVYKHKCVVMPFHSKSSLILHSIWRHSDPRFACTMCPASFSKRYKLLLHQLIVHKRRTFKRLMRKN